MVERSKGEYRDKSSETFSRVRTTFTANAGKAIIYDGPGSIELNSVAVINGKAPVLGLDVTIINGFRAKDESSPRKPSYTVSIASQRVSDDSLAYVIQEDDAYVLAIGLPPFDDEDLNF